MTPRTFFVTQNEPGEQPGVTSAVGLENYVWAVGRDRARGSDYSDAVRAWLWSDSGQLTELTIRRESTSEPDSTDYAAHTWVAVGPDGTEYARVTVAADGRC
jgi:hypothetical protein